MGKPKLLLPIGGQTVLELVVASVRSAGVDELLVVVAPHADELAQRATAAGAHVLMLETDTPDMRATCLHGLAWLEQRFQPAPTDGWLLLPADHPTVRRDVVCALLNAVPSRGRNSILVPSHLGRRGHPTWIQWSHVAEMWHLPPDGGLNQYIRVRRGETLELDWPSDEILRDLDTPEDYQRLLHGK